MHDSAGPHVSPITEPRTDCGWDPCSAKYALRSYWYLLLHGVVAAPAAALFGAARGKVLVFLATRVALGALSAFTEAMLYRFAFAASSISPKVGCSTCKQH